MRKIFSTAVVLGALTLSGCGSTPSAKSTAATATPQRIVSLSPTATESLFAIGAGKQVIAVDGLSDYPATTPRTKLSGFKPNVEAVIGYRPDLVVVSNDTNGIVAALHKVKIRVVLEPAAVKLDDVYRQIEQLGALTGHADRASAVTTGMRQKISATVAATPRTAKPVTYYNELSNDLFTATSKTFIGQVYGLFGLTNIADATDKQGLGYPELSREALLTADPSMIFLADTRCCAQSARTVAARPGWSSLRAVRNAQVIPLDDDIASRWGPRIADLVQTIGTALQTAKA